MSMERKIFPAIENKIDESQGIVEHIFAVFGNIDEGGDIIHPGAFTKTISERGNKIKVLDQHLTDSTLRAIGKPIAIREIGREELPIGIIEKFPEAMGGVKAITQFLMDTPEGKGVFDRIKEGVIDEWSFGYDALDKDYSKVTKDGKEITVRNIRTIKLYEYSPVLWGMNQATSTQSAKSKQPDEGKPWDIFKEGDKWVVYKIDENGDKVGEALGTHDTEEEARAQVEALYANEGKSEDTNQDDKSLDVTKLIAEIESAFDDQFNNTYSSEGWRIWKAWTREVFDDHVIAHHNDLKEFDYYNVSFKRDESNKIIFAPLQEWVGGNYLFVIGAKSDIKPLNTKSGRVIAKRNAERLEQIRKLLQELEEDGGLSEPDEPTVEIPKTTPPERVGDEKRVGSSQTPTSDDLLKLIEIEQLEISYMR